MKFFATLLLLLLLLAGVCGYLLLAPFGPPQETFVDILSGTGSQRMATQLQNAGIIRNRYIFIAWHLFKHGKLKAGEYRFDHPVPLPEVYDRIARGDVYTVQVTIPEGYNLYDIANAIQTAGLGSKSDFLEAARVNTTLINDIAPGATSLEGYLFPDTYRFSHHTTHGVMLATMVKRFRTEASALGLTSDIPRTVTMASLVEKEVRVDTERPLVAGVFENRLRQGMPLATDPTVIYAALLNNRWRGTIYQSDLHFDSPYNTYIHTGLPPGPIANPGIAALKAAIHPAQTDYLYFVADAAGHSVFSADLKGHNQNVQSYRQAIGESPAPPAPSKEKPSTHTAPKKAKPTHRR